MGLFTPAWKGKNDEKAFKFIESCSNEKTLKRIAAESLTVKRKAAALEKIQDQDILFELAMTLDVPLSEKAVNKITDEQLLIKVMEGAFSESARVKAVKRIEDQLVLIKAAGNYEDSSVSSAALSRIGDRFTRLSITAGSPLPVNRIKAAKELSVNEPGEKEILVRFAENDPDPGVRAIAVGRLYDQEFVYKIYKSDQDASVRIAAVKVLRDQDILEEIVRTCTEVRIRNAAIAQITDADKRINYQIECLTDPSALVAEAEKLPDDHPLLTKLALKTNGECGYGWNEVGEAVVKKIHDRDALMHIAGKIDNNNYVQRKIVQELSKEDLIELTGTAAGRAAYEELEARALLDADTLYAIIDKRGIPASILAEDEMEERRIRKKLGELDPELLEAYDKRDADRFAIRPCRATVHAAVFMLKKYGVDNYYGCGPSASAYSVARFLTEVYKNNPELSEDIKEANKYSIRSHSDHGGSNCHEDDGPLIFDF